MSLYAPCLQRPSVAALDLFSMPVILLPPSLHRVTCLLTGGLIRQLKDGFLCTIIYISSTLECICKSALLIFSRFHSSFYFFSLPPSFFSLCPFMVFVIYLWSISLFLIFSLCFLCVFAHSYCMLVNFRNYPQKKDQITLNPNPECRAISTEIKSM